MINESGRGKDLEGSGRGLIGVLFLYFFTGTKEYRENTSFGIRGVLFGIRTQHLSNTNLRPQNVI
jgi:hypothetical protein